MGRYLGNGKKIDGFMVCLCVFLFMIGTTFAATDTDSTEPSGKAIEISEKALTKAMDMFMSVIWSIEKDESLSFEEKIAKAKKFTKVVRWGPELKDPFFMITDQGKALVFVYQPHFVGKDMMGWKDPKGKLVFAEMFEGIKKSQQVMVNHLWPRYKGLLPVPVTSLARLFKPWDIVFFNMAFLDTIEAYEIPEIDLYVPLLLKPNWPPPGSPTGATQ